MRQQQTVSWCFQYVAIQNEGSQENTATCPCLQAFSHAELCMHWIFHTCYSGMLPATELCQLWFVHVQHIFCTCQVGYCTLYTFYAYPDRKRYRLSQILVLPPFQRKSVAANLLKAVYTLAEQINAVDVTVGNLHWAYARLIACKSRCCQSCSCCTVLSSFSDHCYMMLPVGCIWLFANMLIL